MNHKNQGVHVNRIKKAYNLEIWKPKLNPNIPTKQITETSRRIKRK